MEWRRNKVRDLFSRGYSKYEISNTLHINQPTMSRDINFMKNKIKGKKIDPDDLILEECEKTRLVLNEIIKELWKIIDFPTAGFKEKTKSIT
jgi:predicted transcriptional regulator